MYSAGRPGRRARHEGDYLRADEWLANVLSEGDDGAADVDPPARGAAAAVGLLQEPGANRGIDRVEAGGRDPHQRLPVA